MERTTLTASGCRGLGALMAVVLVLAGCTGLTGGGTPEPSPAATPSPTATSAAPAPSGASPSPTTTPSPTATPTLGTLQPSAVPEIEGTPRYRSVLRIETPRWGPGRVELGYQWLRDGRAIGGATGTSYRAAAGDIGHQLTVRITGNRDGYTRQSQQTSPVGPVLGQQLQPVVPRISGTAMVGRTLSASVDPWGPGQVRLTWQWYRGEQQIRGATTRSYALVAGDVAQTIRVRVRGSAENSEPTRRFSAPTAPVARGQLDPTPTPLYSGIAQVGEVVTALPREWGPGEVTLGYQWYRSGRDGDVRIAGATRARYRFVAADEGHRLKVRVSGSRAGFTTVRRYSAWTSEVDPGDLVPDTPTIEGLALVGSVLTAEPGEWRPDGVSFDYRWYRSGLPITKATGAEYSLSGADEGYTITVRVTGRLDGYSDLDRYSEPTDPVVARER